MEVIDIIILVIVVALLATIIYFSFIKNKGDKCTNCSYRKSCSKIKDEMKKCIKK